MESSLAKGSGEMGRGKRRVEVHSRDATEVPGLGEDERILWTAA